MVNRGPSGEFATYLEYYSIELYKSGVKMFIFERNV